MMSTSKDAVINIAFGSIMVLIGVAGLWIVKWSTDKIILASHRPGWLERLQMLLFNADNE
jgi:hypothetical protein